MFMVIYCGFMSVILAHIYLGRVSVTLVLICCGYQCVTLAPLPECTKCFVLALIHVAPGCDSLTHLGAGNSGSLWLEKEKKIGVYIYTEERCGGNLALGRCCYLSVLPDSCTEGRA